MNLDSFVKNFNGFEVPSTVEEERLLLATKHAHPLDTLIAFAETIPNSNQHHKYFIRGNKDYCSVSEFYKQFFSKFDNYAMALKMLQRDDFWKNKKYSQYWSNVKDKSLDESIQIIIKLWNDNGDIQSSLGTSMHRQIELYLNEVECITTKEKDFNHFLTLYSDLQSRGLQVFRTEMMMFDDESKLCGCADVIFIDKNQDVSTWPTTKLKVHLGDWKRSKLIEKNGYGKLGKFVCNKLPDANFYHYSLQLNLYRYILEKHYNLIVETMTIYIFHPNNDNYLELSVKDEQLLIQKMIQLRIENHFQELIEEVKEEVKEEKIKPKTMFIRKRKCQES